MTREERISLFSEQIMCGADIYTWQYAPDMTLIRSNCPAEALLDETLTAFGGRDTLRSYVENENRPVVLTAPIGLMWCFTAEGREVENRSVYGIGPVWSTNASMRTNLMTMEEVHKKYGISMDYLHAMDQAQRELPPVMPPLMYQYALMLHCTVTGEKLGLSDILHKTIHGKTEPDKMQVRDRIRTWQAERSMLKMVRDGNLDYARAFNQASALSKGVPLEDADGLRQAKTSVIVFTSLCTRAAIEGGLSPEEAYSLGDDYIKRIEGSSVLSEIASFSYGMYADFVERVHNKKVNKNLSSPIRAVCDFIELHAEDPFTRRDLAERAGYSEQYLRRKFAEETGISLPDYIRTVRLKRARDLLMNSSLSIQEISERLQFSSRGHFSESFLKHVGLTPAKFRETNS